MKRWNKRWGAAAVSSVALIVLGSWWFFHDPFRRLSSYVVLDNTTLYKPAFRLHRSYRRSRTVFYKNMTVQKLLSTIQGSYPAKDGWKWDLSAMPAGFQANRDVQGDRVPEMVSATLTSEGTIELSETRVVSPAEVQLVKRTMGSDSFIMEPNAPSPVPRRPRNDDDNGGLASRLAYGG